MFNVSDRSSWEPRPISGDAKLVLGDVGRAILLAKKERQRPELNSASQRILDITIAFLERAREGEVVKGVLEETSYPNVSFTIAGTTRRLYLHKVKSVIKHAAFTSVCGDPSNNTPTCYSLDLTWAAQQLYNFLNRVFFSRSPVSARKRRAAIGGYRDQGSLDKYYAKGKEYTVGCIRATNMWMNGRYPPITNAYLWLTFVERYRLILDLLCKDCGATSPKHLLQLCGCPDAERFVTGVPIRLAEVLDDIDPAAVPVDLQDYIEVTPTGFQSKLPYADPVAVILTAAGHVGSGHDHASGHLRTWKATSNSGYGYYEFETEIMAIDDKLDDVRFNAADSGSFGIVAALSDSQRELSGNVQVFLDEVRLYVLRTIVADLEKANCEMGLINGDGIYFYSATNPATVLSHVLSPALELTLESHSGGPACTKSICWIQNGTALDRPAVPCSHQYAIDTTSPPKRRRVLKNDVIFASVRSEAYQNKLLNEITYSEIVDKITEDLNLTEEDKMPPSMPFARLCAIVSAAFNLVTVQRCYVSSGVKKTAEEAHVCGLYGHDSHQLSNSITTGNMVIPLSSGASITFQLLLAGGHFDTSWKQPFEKLLVSNSSHKALAAKFDAWGQLGRPCVDPDSILDAHLGPDFVLPTEEAYYGYGPHLDQSVRPEARIHPVVLYNNSEGSSPDWPYYTTGRTYKIFCDAECDWNSIRSFEETLREYYSGSGGFAHEAWGSLLPLALSAVRRTDLISDFFLVTQHSDGRFEILKDDFGHLCRRPLCEAAIGLSGDNIVAPDLLVAYLTNDTVESLPAGTWDDLQDEIKDIMSRYPLGVARYEWIQDYFDHGMDPSYFSKDMEPNVIKLLNVFFGMGLGQHLVKDLHDDVNVWTVCYGEPKSGKGTLGQVQQRIIPETSVIVPDSTAFAGQQFFRPDGRLGWTFKIPDPTGPLHNTVDFRRLQNGDFQTNVKNSAFRSATTRTGEILPVPSGNIDLNNPALLVPSSSSLHDVQAVVRRIAPYRYVSPCNSEQPVKYIQDPSLKRLPGIQDHLVVLLAKNCFRRLREECRRENKTLVEIYPEIHDGGDEPDSGGYLHGKQKRLTEDIRRQQARLESVERYLLEGLEHKMGGYVLIDALYDEVSTMFSKKMGKRKFYSMLLEIVNSMDTLVQIQHKATLSLCGSRKVNGHVFAGSCCVTPEDIGPQTYRVITNVHWVS